VQLVTILPASGLFKRHNICHKEQGSVLRRWLTS
jgi:hypothetical protein